MTFGQFAGFIGMMFVGVVVLLWMANRRDQP